MTSPAELVRAHTVLARPFLVPELELHLATHECALWRATEEDLARVGLPEPYWAFTWAGGEALARHVLDHPATVRGRRVLSFGAGSGVEAIAAARSGAARVVANDVDPVACAAVALNAAHNGVEVETVATDLVGALDLGVDLVLCGDSTYSTELARRLRAWFLALADAGVEVLIADPGRGYLDPDGMEVVAVHQAPADIDMDGSNLLRTAIYRVRPRKPG